MRKEALREAQAAAAVENELFKPLFHFEAAETFTNCCSQYVDTAPW